jgi:hypothetical protein
MVLSGILLLLAVLLIRLSVVIPTTKRVTGSNIGVIPWSDATGWVQGAEQIAEGRRMAAFPSRRPLYPLFLSIVFALTGGAYLNAILAQTFLFSLMLTLVFFLYKDLPKPYFVAFFLACMVIWKPIFHTWFLTENLGLIFILPGFALIWMGLEKDESNQFYGGLFFYGLSMAVRPWAVMCLVTLPFLSFYQKSRMKKKLKTFLICALFLSLGMGLHFIASYIFGSPNAASNFPQTLYGRVIGGKGWHKAASDPVISKAMQANLSPQEINQVIYRRSLKLFLQRPQRFFHAALITYKDYAKNLKKAFQGKWLFFVAFMVFVLFLIGFAPIRTLLQHGKENPALWGLFMLMAISFQYFGLFCFLVGTFMICRRIKDIRSGFILLHFLGILLTLPLIGEDGGERVKISSDIAIFLTGAIGFQNIINLDKSTFHTNPYGLFKLQLNRTLLIAPIAMGVFFIGVPLVLKTVGAGVRQPVPALSEMTGQQIASALQLKEIPLDAEELSNLQAQWPAPSFENLDQATAFLQYKYASRDAIYLQADQGISTHAYYFWPMQKTDPPYARTIHPRTWTIFPNLKKDDLNALNEREILVWGRLITRARKWKYNTGYALIAEQIALLDDDHHVKWLAVTSLGKSLSLN